MKTTAINYPFPPGVQAYTSGRTVDFSSFFIDQDNATNKQQRDYLFQEFPLDAGGIVNVKQVHGKRIIRVTRDNIAKCQAEEEADGLITSEPYLAIAIRTADCLPLFLYDIKEGCIGLVHAGWRGTLKKIAAEALRIMRAEYDSRPDNVLAALGPCLRPCCYEVSADFVDFFNSCVETRDGKCYFDLAGENKSQLIAEGVPEKNIHDERVCTCCNKGYFSYRREGADAGRMISVMMLKTMENS